MPVFQRNVARHPTVRPSGDVEPNRTALAALLGIPLDKMPPVSSTVPGDLMVLPEGAAGTFMSNPATAVDEFRRSYCQLPAGGFADQAAIDTWHNAHGWCPVPTGPITPTVIGTVDPRETLRIRLGIPLASNMPTAAEGLTDAFVAVLNAYPSGPVGDADVRMKFQNTLCALPTTPFTNNTDIDAWNRAHRWCTPIPQITTTTTTSGGTSGTGARARLQTQLALPALPSVIDLTDATADAILALPAGQMVDAFRARFCNPPVFTSNAARDAWIQANPWCPAPPAASMLRSPWLWLGGAILVGGGAWWLIAKDKKKKSKKA